MCTDQIEDLYEKLHLYVHWLAHESNSTWPLHFLLSPDDLAGELFCEMVYVYNYYRDRDDIDNDTMIQIIKVSLDNRIRELIVHWHKSSRREDMRNVQLSAAYPDAADTQSEGGSPNRSAGSWTHDGYEEYRPTDEYQVPDPFELSESFHRVKRFLRSLTGPEREIVEAVLGMDERIARQAQLVGTRKAFVYKYGGTVTMKASLVADALHLDREECAKLWRSIRHKWRKYERS